MSDVAEQMKSERKIIYERLIEMSEGDIWRDKYDDYILIRTIDRDEDTYYMWISGVILTENYEAGTSGEYVEDILTEIFLEKVA